MYQALSKKKQNGAALVIVMALLAAGLIVGVSGMNASYIDERLAANYLAVSQANINAEKAISQAIQDVVSASSDPWSSARELNYENLENSFEFDDAESTCGGTNLCLYKFVKVETDFVAIAQGGVNDKSGNLIAKSKVIATIFKPESGVKNILEDIVLSGDLINVVDSYNFDSSKNSAARAWESKISSNGELFDSANAACEIKNSLKTASGNVEFVNAEIDKDALSELSGKLVVIEGDGFKMPNNTKFSGVLIVFGKDLEVRGGGNTEFEGAIIHAPVDCEKNEFKTPNINIRGGNGNFNSGTVQDIIDEIESEESSSNFEITGWKWDI